MWRGGERAKSRSTNAMAGFSWLQPNAPWRWFLLGRFWIDSLASIPFELFSDIIKNKTARKSIKLVKYFKIPRLLRLGRLLKYLKKYAKYYQLTIISLSYMLGAHMSGCMWITVAGICDDEDQLHVEQDPNEPYLPDDDPIWDTLTKKCHVDHTPYWYAKGLHAGIAMLLGTSPWQQMTLDEERGEVVYASFAPGVWVYASIVMTFGLFFIGAFIAEITVIFSNTNQSIWRYRKKMDLIKAEMAAFHLSENLQYRVKKYLDYIWMNRDTMMTGESVLLNDSQLSISLRNEVALHMSRRFVCKISWLQNCEDDDLLAKLCMNLKTAIYMPGDFVFHEGDVGHELYIIKKGIAEVVRRVTEDTVGFGDGHGGEVVTPKHSGCTWETLAEVQEGGVFGEMALLSELARRTASVRAQSICEMGVLMQKHFDIIRKEHPQFNQQMQQISKVRHKASMLRAVGKNLPAHEAALDASKRPTFINEGKDKVATSHALSGQDSKVNTDHHREHQKIKGATSGFGYSTTVARSRADNTGAVQGRGSNAGNQEVSLVQNYTSAAELVDHSPGSDFTTSVAIKTIPEFTTDAIDAARLIQELADIHDNNAASMAEAIQSHGSAIAAAEAAQASADLALAKARRLSNCREGDPGLVHAATVGLAAAPGPRTGDAGRVAGGSELQLQLKMMEERLLFKLQEIARSSTTIAQAADAGVRVKEGAVAAPDGTREDDASAENASAEGGSAEGTSADGGGSAT